MIIKITDFQPNNYKDYEEIYKMYQFDLSKQNDTGYINQMGEQGFLSGDPYPLEFVKKAPIFLLAFANNELAGLIRIDKQDLEHDEERYELVWQDKVIKSIFDQNISVELAIIMVKKEYTHHGIADKLLEVGITKAHELNFHHIFAWITTKPYNKASVDFHIKRGFREVASFECSEYEGLKNYHSQILYREI